MPLLHHADISPLLHSNRTAPPPPAVAPPSSSCRYFVLVSRPYSSADVLCRALKASQGVVDVRTDLGVVQMTPPSTVRLTHRLVCSGHDEHAVAPAVAPYCVAPRQA